MGFSPVLQPGILFRVPFEDGEEVVWVVLVVFEELVLVDWHKQVRETKTRRKRTRGKRDLCFSDEKAMFSLVIHSGIQSLVLRVLRVGRCFPLEQKPQHISTLN